MGFGGLYPLPLRLGGPPEEGWSVEQHARMSCDVAAMAMGSPLAIIRVSVSAGGVPTVDDFIGRGGFDPTRISVAYAAGVLSIELGSSYYDEDAYDYRGWSPMMAMATVIDHGPTAAPLNGTDVEITMAVSHSVLVIVHGSVEERTMGDYGASLNKQESTTEGEAPYAYTWLLEQDAEKGSAYSHDPDALVRFEAIAKARMLGFGQRMAEAMAAQQLPACADGLLYRWAEILGINPGLKDWQIRNAAAAKMALFSGCNDVTLNEAVRLIMGQSFVELVRFPGTLETPPEPTFWQYGTVGPWSLALDSDGAFMSWRCRLMVALQRTAGMSDSATFRLVENELRKLLANALPAVATFGAGYGTGGGFLLGTDILGRDSL